MENPVASSHGDAACRARRRKQLTLPPKRWPETALAPSQKRTPRTVELCQKDQASRPLRRLQESGARNPHLHLLSCHTLRWISGFARPLLQYPVQRRAARPREGPAWLPPTN
jgi:hypothetical protein